MFRGEWNETVTVVSNEPKTEYVCPCGARKFALEETSGSIKVGGFKPDNHVYRCLGCGKRHSDVDVARYFK